MKKAILLLSALAFIFLAVSCDTGSSGGTDDDPGATGGETPGGGTPAITETSFSVSLSTTTGSTNPGEFTATCTWQIKDADWVAGDVYTVQAFFAGSSGAPVPIGTAHTLESLQTGTGTYAFTIPGEGIPSSVVKPYAMNFVMKKGETEIRTFKFTEGKLTGEYSGTLYYFTAFDADDNPTDGNGYDFRASLVQLGPVVLASDIYYLEDTNDDDVNDKETPQVCTVIMSASETDGMTKLVGVGTYTDEDGATRSYTGKATVFGDARSISCDGYWVSEDPAKKVTGNFSCTLNGTASVKGRVTISNPDGKTLVFTDPTCEEGVCVAALLFGLDEDNLENNAGKMVMGPVQGTSPDYYFDYEIKDVPAGEYYVFFGGIDQGEDIAEDDRLPDKAGEAVGLRGTTAITDLAVLADWLGGEPSVATKAAIEALEPIVVKEGETVLSVDFNAVVQ